MRLPLYAEKGRRVACQICINIRNLPQVFLGEEGERCYFCCSCVEVERFKIW